MCFLVEFLFLVDFYMKRVLTYALLLQSISLMQKEKNWMHFQSRREKTHSSDEKTHKWNSQLLMVHILLLHTYMQCSDVLLEMWSVYSYILTYLLTYGYYYNILPNWLSYNSAMFAPMFQKRFKCYCWALITRL